MSRSDFWSIAATLIVASVAYFVGGQKTAYGCLALGAVIILYLLSTHKKSEAPSSVTATQKVTANPKMEANPEMSQSQNVHFHLPGSAKQEKPPLISPKAKPKHNLQFHSCKMLQIDENLGPHGKYPAWWANEVNPKTRHSQCRAWTDAGWKVESVDLNGETVEFVRVPK